jgi:hypothetical protein
MSYKSLIQMIVDGELVSAGVANRAPRDLQGNVDYLKTILEEALVGSTIYAREATVEADAQVGQPVYYDSVSQSYKRARAAVDTDGTTGTLVTAPSTWAWGVITRKINSTNADILLTGVADVDLSQSISGTPVSGMYYLSASTPGYLVSQMPPVTVPVLMVAGEGDTSGTYSVLVRPDFRDLLTAHKHHRFPLVCAPAGNTATPDVGGVHTITDADSSVEGWLPADDAVFGGLAPSGAKFGYNISASELDNVWPPIPVTNATLEIYHQDEQDGSTGHPIHGGPVHGDACVIDENGIWWMLDCYGMVPWPTDYQTPISTTITDYLDCPEPLEMEAILWIGKPQFHDSATAVLSLRAAEDSGLAITCYGTGDDASTGHLEIDLDLNLQIDATDETGYNVFKSFSSAGKVNTGPVVEGVKSGTANVTVSGDEQDANGYNKGLVTVSVDQSLDGTHVPVEVVQLNGAEEEFYQGVIGLGFDPNHASEVVMKVKVPDAADLPVGTTMKLRFWVLVRETGTLPSDVFTGTYRRILRPPSVAEIEADTEEPSILPTSDSTITIDTDLGEEIEEDEYFEAESSAFVVTAGDVVLITLTRLGSDGYSGDLHVIHKAAILVEP